MPRGDTAAETATLLEITRELVAANTVSHRSNRDAMARLGERLTDAGFTVTLQEWRVDGVPKANLLAQLGPAEPDGLLLSGHLDTVPFENQPGWTREPLALSADGDRLYGRGTTDMKGFLAQCVVAGARLRTAPLRRPLLLAFTADEETGCLGAARLTPELPRLLGATPPPRLCWIGEPTSWQVFRAHKGMATFTVRVRGEGGHSSLPEAGVNAISVAAQLLARLGALQQELRENPSAEFARVFPAAPYTTFNFGTITGGSAHNMIPETCEFVVSYRPLPDEEPENLWNQISSLLQDNPPPDWGSGRRAHIEVGELLSAPGLLTPEGGALERVLCERVACAAAGGAPYCTDAGRFAQAGIDSIICGPGELDEAHQPDESVSRRALVAGVEHIVRVVEKLCT